MGIQQALIATYGSNGTLNPLALEFDGTAQHVNHGAFWQADVAYFRFFADFMIKPTGSGYFLSAGYGGAHCLLAGTDGSEGGPYIITGNVRNDDTSTTTTFTSKDSIRHNEWAYVSIAYNETNLYVYINGIPSAKIDLATQRKTPDPTDAVIFIGGSDHLNFHGRIAGVRIFEIATGGAMPFTTLASVKRPPIENFGLASINNGADIISASFLADYRTGSLADISNGMNGQHNGYLAEATVDIAGEGGYYNDVNLYNRDPSLVPNWVVDPFTWPTSSAASKTPIPDTRIFDDFARPDKHKGNTTTLTLGTTTTGNKTWTTPGNHYGILNGNAYMDDTNEYHAVITDNQTDGTIIWKRPAVVDLTGTSAVYRYLFRYTDESNYEELYLDESNTCLVREIIAGVGSSIGASLGGGGTWTEVKLVLSGTTATVYKDGVSLGSKTMTGNLSGTGKGLGFNHPLLRCSEFGVI